MNNVDQLSARKVAVLKAAVTSYIKTGQPVGSFHICNTPGIKASGATVRNEMAYLEKEGYLQQLHTSSGRIPTEKGYRYFVDLLSVPISLNPTKQLEVKSFFEHTVFEHVEYGEHTVFELDQLLSDISSLLSRLTNYPAIVVELFRNTATIKSIQLVRLASQAILAVAVLSDGSIIKRLVELQEQLSDKVLQLLSEHLARFLNGRSIASLKLNTEPDTPLDCKELISLDDTGAGLTVQRDLVTALRGVQDDGLVYVSGIPLALDLFKDMMKIQEVLGLLEEKYRVLSLLTRLYDKGEAVVIGTESAVEALCDCSLVITPYTTYGCFEGILGVLGPICMDYAGAIAAVEEVGSRLSRCVG
ncbi:MAG: heat-inducible transcriptional repressor HrcA [Actinobacteria bacterium]|nr:heat-inducible transcriptional repressor HrcA [Actinomycetota bacterium]MCL6105024.1 heat-inducible transcriptional repressor HrcA [Actinomycetota bacterium]